MAAGAGVAVVADSRRQEILEMRDFNILALSLTAQLLLAGPGQATRPQGRGFTTTGAAVKALVTAANADDVNALI